MTRLVKGLVDAIVYILDGRNKRKVAAVMKKHLRLNGDEDAETSYYSLRSITSLDIAPDPAAWKNVQRFIAQVNPRAGQLDVNDSINLSVINNRSRLSANPLNRRTGLDNNATIVYIRAIGIGPSRPVGCLNECGFEIAHKSHSRKGIIS